MKHKIILVVRGGMMMELYAGGSMKKSQFTTLEEKAEPQKNM